MPSFTIHEERLYTVEAETAKEALEKFESNRDRPDSSKFHIPSDSYDTYVTDENGEEIPT